MYESQHSDRESKYRMYDNAQKHKDKCDENSTYNCIVLGNTSRENILQPPHIIRLQEIKVKKTKRSKQKGAKGKNDLRLC